MFSRSFPTRPDALACSRARPSVSRGTRRIRRAALAALAAVLVATPAAAEIEVFKDGGLSLSAGFEAGAYYAHTEGANFGLGKVDLRSGAVSDGSVDSIDAYVKPSASVAFDSGVAGIVYSGFSAVGTATRGDGDPGGFTAPGEDDFAPEHVFAGWRSGKLLDALGEDAIDLSYGRQEFQIGDGFLIKDGDFDQFDKAAYWLAPRNAFKRAGLARINTKPVRADLFYLKSDADQDSTELGGVNVEYVHEKRGTVGASYMQIVDSDDNVYIRDGMDIASLRAQGTPIPGLEDLFLAGEYVDQSGGDNGTKIDAQAWYGEVAYTLSSVPWSPKLAYRYSRFSGDNPATAATENFDPLFYGYTRGYGTWFQGEIVGEYLLFNSNQRTHMVHASAAPSDAVGLGVIYYNFQLDRTHYFGTPVTDRGFADEINVYVDWYPLDYLSIGALAGIATPGQGAKDAFGDDETIQLIQVYATVTL